MSETSSRLLELLSLLQGRRDWPGGELAERLGVSRRTVRRDVDRLRELGYPIDSLVGPAGGYRLAAGAEVPPLLLDDEEAVAIAVGLRTAAQAAVEGMEEASLRALVKLEQVLPARLRHRLSALQSAELLSYRGPTVDPQCLATVGAACRDSERVRFAYRDRGGAETRREVEPHSLVNAGRRWYLVAWDLKREDWRSFRLDRIARPAPMGVRSKERTLPTKDAATYVMQSVRNMPSRYEASIILHAPAEQIRPRLPAGWGDLKPLSKTRCEYRAGDDDLDWLALRIAMLRCDFEVRDCPELRERLGEMAERLRQGAGAGDAGGVRWAGYDKGGEMSNVDTAKASYEAFSSGDMETLSGYFAENAEWESSDQLPNGGTTSGRDAIIENFGRIPQYWSEFSVTPEDFIDGGDKVVIKGTQRATAAEGGGQFEAGFLHLMEFDADGKLVRGEFITDSAKALKALG